MSEAGWSGGVRAGLTVYLNALSSVSNERAGWVEPPEGRWLRPRSVAASVTQLSQLACKLSLS